MLSTCTPYFRELLEKASPKDRKMLFKAACCIFASNLKNTNPHKFCREIGVPDDYIPIFYELVS